MKTTIASLTVAAFALTLTNCAAPAGPNTQRGAATGALLGAGTGAIIGHQSGNTAGGALIGAAAGGTAGALIGNKRDQDQYGY